MRNRLISVFFAASATCWAAVIFPGTLTVPAVNPAGVSFTFSGTLTQADTIAFAQTGDPCLQSGPVYCTNGAGVVTTAGTSPVGAATTFSGTFGGTTATWDFGALLLEISGVGTVQVFPATAANGLGSATPPASLTRATASLSTLGFPNFSVVNPTITFVLADTLYTDNSGSFTLTQSSVPEPASLFFVALGSLMAALIGRRVTSRTTLPRS